MAPAPNFGVFLDFGHPFLTEVDFLGKSKYERIYQNSCSIRDSNMRERKFRLTRTQLFWLYYTRGYNPTLSINVYMILFTEKQDERTILAISERLKGEMKGKRNEASHPRLDIMFFHKRHK